MNSIQFSQSINNLSLVKRIRRCTESRTQGIPRPTKLHLFDLSTDILREIFDHTEVLQPSDLLNLARTCKTLHSSIPTKRLFGHIRFIIPRDSFSETSQVQKFISVIDQYPERLSWVQEAEFTRVVIHEYPWGLELEELLRRLSSLHTLKKNTNAVPYATDCIWPQ
jgi:hypothetical protein